MFENELVKKFLGEYGEAKIPRSLEEYQALDLNQDDQLRGALLFNQALALGSPPYVRRKHRRKRRRT